MVMEIEYGMVVTVLCMLSKQGVEVNVSQQCQHTERDDGKKVKCYLLPCRIMDDGYIRINLIGQYILELVQSTSAGVTSIRLSLHFRSQVSKLLRVIGWHRPCDDITCLPLAMPSVQSDKYK